MRQRVRLTLILVLLGLAPHASAAEKRRSKSPARTSESTAATAKAEQAKAAAKKAADDAQVVRTFVAGSPEAVLRDIIHCGADEPDESAAFDCWLKLHLAQNRDTETAVIQLRHYAWKVFRSRANSYAVKPAATTDKDFALRIARREPETCAPTATECKFFLVSRVRDLPAPVTLRMEDGQWRIYSISL